MNTPNTQQTQQTPQNEPLSGEAAGKVPVPDTDFAALADEMLSDAEDGFVFDEEDSQQQEGGGPSEEEGQGQEGLLKEGQESGEEPPLTPAEEEQPAGEAAPAPDMVKLRQTEVERLTGVYALSDEDARTMTVEPEKVVPRLMAEMHANVVEAVVAVLGAQLPSVVESLTNQVKVRASTEDAFYGKFPALRDKKFEKTVQDSLRIARTSDPKASVDEVLTQAGILASLKHRVPLPKELMPGAEVTAPGVGQSGKPGQQPRRSFVPTAPGGSSATSKQPRNEFEALADEFLDEDTQ